MVVYTCSTMSPIMPSTVGPPESFLHRMHPPRLLLHKLCGVEKMLHFAAGSFWEKLSAALCGMADSATTMEIPKH